MLRIAMTDKACEALLKECEYEWDGACDLDKIYKAIKLAYVRGEFFGLNSTFYDGQKL